MRKKRDIPYLAAPTGLQEKKGYHVPSRPNRENHSSFFPPFSLTKHNVFPSPARPPETPPAPHLSPLTDPLLSPIHKPPKTPLLTPILPPYTSLSTLATQHNLLRHPTNRHAPPRKLPRGSPSLGPTLKDRVSRHEIVLQCGGFACYYCVSEPGATEGVEEGDG